MNKEESCYICDSSVEIKYNLLQNETEKFKIVKCKKCGLLRLSPLPDKLTIEQIYTKNSSQKNLEFEVFSSKYLTILKRFLIIEPLLKRLKNKYIRDEQTRLLDIGCSTGWITSVSRDLGFDVIGLEVNPYLAQFGRENYNLKIIESYVEEFSSDEKFNSVSMFHVLEHLPDPLKALKKVATLLDNNGNLLIVVPNSKSLGVSIFKEHYNWNVPNHISFFSSDTIKLLLNKAGFKVVEIQHLISPPLLLYSFNNLMKNRRKSNFIVNNPYVGNFLFTPLSILAKLLNRGEVIAIYATKD